MYAMVGGRWSDNWLDEAVGPDEVRVEVHEWVNVTDVPDLYFARSGSLHFLLGQLKRLGPADMYRKIRSRLAERGRRNDRVVAVGSGRVLKAGTNVPAWCVGRPVRFVAPRHPPGVERVVLALGLCDVDQTMPGSGTGTVRVGEIKSEALRAGTRVDLAKVAGWHAESGEPVPVAALASLQYLPLAVGRVFTAGSNVVTSRGSRPPAAGRPRLLVVGYGNYAKTVAIPGLSKHLQLAGVCESDPFQIPTDAGGVFWSTSYEDADLTDVDVVLAAGYHHTHTPVAVRALESGKDVIVEKPIFTDERQAERLLAASEASTGRLFYGFQRRFSPLNRYLVEDLGSAHLPRDYHCIVFEEELPARHWYRWPVSGGRITSNGCHWIDHFLSLNPEATVIDHTVLEAGADRTVVVLQLSNGALMTMTLTSEGSPRLGMRDYIEIRSGTSTVKIVDSSVYEAESGDRRVRRRRVAPLAAHHSMYRTIGRRIAEGSPGDAPDLTLRSGLATVHAAASARD